MRLSWNEIRTRAAQFAKDWDGEGYEKGQTQLFYRDFFDVFGIPVRRVASFEEPVKNLGDKRGFIDLFWKGMLLVEQKSLGRDLKKAKTQWTCHAFVPLRLLTYAAFASKAKGLFQPRAECLRRGL